MWTRIGMIGVVLAAAALWWWGRSPERPRLDRAREGLEAVREKREPVDRELPPLEEGLEGHALDEDIGEIEEICEEGPLDPVEKGACELFLLVVDEETHRPVATRVSLWRLDAPGNADWTRGDQLQATRSIGVGGSVLHDLPAGNYRVTCEAQRKGEDPPAFVVDGTRTRHEIASLVVREFTVRLRVFDEAGQPTTAGTLRSMGSTESRPGTTPPWVRSRQLRDPKLISSVEIDFDEMQEDDPAMTRIEAGAYVLGTVRENSRTVHWERGWVLGWDGGTRVSVNVAGSLDADRTYVAVTVPLNRIRALIRIPGNAVSPKFEAECEAVALTKALPPDVWRTLPITVTVRVKGYKPLAFHYRIDGPNRVHTLVSD